jgi:RsiG-like
VEPLPDLLPLSDDELAALRAQLEDAEDAVSKRRRLLHGRIDILRAERTARLKAQVAAGRFEAHTPTSLDRPIYEGTGELATDGELEPLPDLATTNDDALWAEIRRLEQEEDDISLNRRVIHAQIDIVAAERAKRSRAGGHVDADDLGSILGGGA